MLSLSNFGSLLLNGSSYNFIFVDGEQGRLQKVILTGRAPSF